MDEGTVSHKQDMPESVYVRVDFLVGIGEKLFLGEQLFQDKKFLVIQLVV